MSLLYRRAGGPEDLPWHSEEPPRLLDEAVASRAPRGRALDVGCGSGVFAVQLARQGFQVTGVDFVADAIRMARERADAAGVDVQLVEADVLEWRPEDRFDLVLDRGCLHTLAPGDRPAYGRQLLRWVAPHGDYVLGHFLKRHQFDWRPVGPRRRRHEQIVAMFEPDFELRRHERERVTVPLPVGPRVLAGSYWFHRLS